ncbi:hypothetical protein ONZ43_g356 [Nemania bipapillata]|uniref:Uncharacterized protein n=1 Tax=Nemania bipapillata TaxID=110536 RepID=A0ACC2J8P2_9PEZI|nr:hypothetical protein ONZ43_g356 [Nemania bipapillata]
MPPQARTSGSAYASEEDSFSPGISWALCFFQAIDPMSVEFRPPRTGPMSSQAFAIYIPNHHLHLFMNNAPAGSSWQPRLREGTAHCTMKLFKCNQSGVAERLPLTFRAYWDAGGYQDGNFKFVSESQLAGDIELCYYFAQCEFYKSQWELDNPDETYTTGIFRIRN